MITAEIFSGHDGNITGCKVDDHGEVTVCAAVSLLVLNTANSIEAFTDDDFSCDYEEEGGLFSIKLENPGLESPETKVLLKALVLGLKSTRDEYPSELCVIDVESEVKNYD